MSKSPKSGIVGRLICASLPANSDGDYIDASETRHVVPSPSMPTNTLKPRPHNLAGNMTYDGLYEYTFDASDLNMRRILVAGRGKMEISIMSLFLPRPQQTNTQASPTTYHQSQYHHPSCV
jgi:hypothetical protein